jgi:hypothetical protein
MNLVRKHMPFLASALLMVLVLVLVYPHYQYYIDPDGTAYLTISRRYADGDFANAINGYWSPWSCWLTALVIKCSLQPIPASVVVNTLGGAGFLYITHSLFLKFEVKRVLQWILCVALSLFLCYAIFWQSFDDIWECFFLLCGLRILLADAFTYRPWLWVALGITGTMAYFAKSYSFPFFILNTICCIYLLSKNERSRWLKAAATAITVMVVCSLPWIWMLHGKYDIWTTSTAGSLNTSWYVVGHPFYKTTLGGLLPPAYPGSPYFWEDPYLVNGDTPHFWSSGHLLVRQLLKIGQNGYKLMLSMLQLSVFFPVILLVAILLLTSRKLKPVFTADIAVVALSFLLFPLGYLLVNFESRYIWYMLTPGLVMGALVLQNFSDKKVLYLVAAATFIVFPAWKMYELYDAGKEEFQWAQELRLRNIKGPFTCIAAPGTQTQSAARLAYFSGNSFYAVKPPQITETELVAEMKRYSIKYFYMYTHPGKLFYSIPQKLAADGNRITETDIGETVDLKVYQVH